MLSVRRRIIMSTILLALTGAATALAQETSRWTGATDQDATLPHVLAQLSAQVGYTLTEANFVIGEDRQLATSRYQRFDQVAAGIPIRGMSLRLWTDSRGLLIQAEAQTKRPGDIPDSTLPARPESDDAIGRAKAMALAAARAQLSLARDRIVRDIQVDRLWDAGRLVYVVRIKAGRGTYETDVDSGTGRVLQSRYTPYAHADAAIGGLNAGEISVPALVYPVYEEYGDQQLPRRHARLRYLSRDVGRPTQDPFAPLRTRQYFYRFHDAARAEQPADRAAGYWSMAWLRREIETIQRTVPRSPNDFGTGVLLSGLYATVSIHPDAFSAFPGIQLPQQPSLQALFRWREDTAQDDWEVIPEAAAIGRPLQNRMDALRRDATRHPQHDVASYINSGFDEIQVYYAINMLFDTLRPMGFTDPDLSERPFHAFLYDPDIENKDNAFYVDDTINFTTYSPGQLNMARDNTTIWHELGHGVMDRMMGQQLQLADTGGLSEGMADFVAELVLQAATNDADFPGKQTQRIINNTGFFLTNEVHDDGEAYGGAMKSMLDLMIQTYGRAGLVKMTDLVLETMRLCRDHPALTAEIWFDRMQFADSLGHAGIRGAGELAPLIDQALAMRNFAPESDRGHFIFKYQGQDVAADTPGSRGNDIEVQLAPGATGTYELEVQAVDGTNFHFNWPVEVRVYFNRGPLQGAIDWDGEDQEPRVLTLNGPDDSVALPLTINSVCDWINRADGSCSDFVYVQLYNRGATDPIGKKRFYVRMKPLVVN